MVCTNCGALIPDRAFKCPSCGRPMRATEVLASPPALDEKIRYAGVEGWLAALVLYLILLLPAGTVLDVGVGIWYLLAGPRAGVGETLFSVFAWLLGTLVAGSALYAGIKLLNRTPNAVTLAKRVLMCCLIGGLVLSVQRHGVSRENLWGLEEIPILPVICYAYLSMSRRVANTYRHQTA